MALYTRPDSPFWYCFLEGTKRKVNTRIPHSAMTAEGRRANKIAAEAVYHQHMVNLAKRRVGLPGTSTITFQQYSEWYETHVIATHKSAKAETSLLTTLRAFFGPTLLSEIRASLVSEYEAERLKKGRKRGTVNREIAMLRAMLNRAVGEHLEPDPMGGFTMKHERSKPKRTITKDEEPALLTALLAADPELHDLYVVGVGTLLREHNLITLRRRQLRGSQVVVDAKAGPHSLDLRGPTDLQTRALAVLRKRLPADHDGFFFPVWGQQFTDKATSDPGAKFLRRVKAVFAEVNLPWGLDNGGLVWHTATRATGATRMLQDYQVDIRTVQMMGPWASLDQMAEYLGVRYTPR